MLQDLLLPDNVSATTSTSDAIAGASFAVHALPVQHSRAFLTSIKVSARHTLSVAARLCKHCVAMQGTKEHVLLTHMVLFRRSMHCSSRASHQVCVLLTRTVNA